MLTTYLAKLLGLYCVIVSLALSLNKQSAIGTVNDWMKSPPLTMLTGVITLTIGLALVIGHNVWSGGALTVTVTVLGWLTLIKGLTFLALPPARAARFYEALEYERFFFVYMGVTFVLGLYLIVSAFSA
jgi:vacuolar-type H+-ATPase subunit I/STV1